MRACKSYIYLFDLVTCENSFKCGGHLYEDFLLLSLMSMHWQKRWRNFSRATLSIYDATCTSHVNDYVYGLNVYIWVIYLQAYASCGLHSFYWVLRLCYLLFLPVLVELYGKLAGNPSPMTGMWRLHMERRRGFLDKVVNPINLWRDCEGLICNFYLEYLSLFVLKLLWSHCIFVNFVMYRKLKGKSKLPSGGTLITNTCYN